MGHILNRSQIFFNIKRKKFNFNYFEINSYLTIALNPCFWDKNFKIIFMKTRPDERIYLENLLTEIKKLTISD